MAQFYTLLTDVGQAKLANAVALGQTIEITELAVGDGGGSLPTPDSGAESLINEVRRAPINTSTTDPDNPSWIVVEQVLPPDVGGWTIREIGIYDVDGDLVGIGNYPETYKPVLAEGSSRTQTVRFVLEVSDTAAVTLKVDPSVVLATREYVDQERAEHEASRNHPAATTTAQGMVEKATITEAKTGATDKYPDAAGVQAAITDSRSSDQFATYDAARTYTTGEIARGSDGQFYEFYDRDQAGAVQGVDPTDPLNRPHVWMEWHGVRPGTVIEWRSETLPEGYVENDGAEISRGDYRRIFAVLGTTYGEGDGSTTFQLPDDRGEFKRGWDHGRGVDNYRTLAVHQDGTIVIGDNNTSPAQFGAKDARDLRADSGSGLSLEGLQFAGPELSSTTLSGSSYLGVSRPRNNAVIYLTKI
ncbi:MAG: phage tail protein [Pseudomonadota bacterium]